MNARTLNALVAGLLFGAGLALGGMTDPGKVIGFLDVAGRWDPSLAFVMGAALAITLPVFRAVVPRRRQPLFETRFHLPTLTRLDAPLLTGAALFGIGWGIAGLCPGPAIANLASGQSQVLGFVAAMLAGMWLRDRLAAPPKPSGNAEPISTARAR